MNDYEKLIAQVRKFTTARLEHYFKKRRTSPDSSGFRAAVKQISPLGKFIQKHRLNGEEQLLLALVLMPHLDSVFYSDVIQQALSGGGDFHMTGIVKANHHSGFIPTGETAMFIIAGTEYKKRSDVLNLLKSSVLVNKGIISMVAVDDSKPEMNSKIIIEKENAEQILTGMVWAPSISLGFPLQQVETKLEWVDLVLTKEVLDQIEELKTWIEQNDRLTDKREMH